MHVTPATQPDGRGLRIAIVMSEYHHEVTSSMAEACRNAFMRSGGEPASLTMTGAPGAFELTAICRAIAFGPRPPHAIVALGCVITGQTMHDQYIAQAVTQGLTALTVQTGVPIAFGVLTCRTLQQARERSCDAASVGGVNKGEEAMNAAIATAQTIRRLQASEVR